MDQHLHWKRFQILRRLVFSKRAGNNFIVSKGQVRAKIAKLPTISPKTISTACIRTIALITAIQQRFNYILHLFIINQSMDEGFPSLSMYHFGFFYGLNGLFFQLAILDKLIFFIVKILLNFLY